MRAWFESLESRERMFVAAAAGTVMLAILYLGIWMPLERGHRKAAASVQTWKAAVAEVQPLRLQLQATGTRQPAAGSRNQSLVLIIDNTLRQHGLYSALQRSQPVAQNGIRVEFENAAFDDLVLWLGDLSKTYGLQLQSGSFSATSPENQGRVNATLTLER
jgi:general secretion pathway protein M